MDVPLAEKISSLKQELKFYGDEIVKQVTAIHSSVAGSINLRNDPRNALQILQEDVSSLLLEAQTHSQHISAHKQELDECKEMMLIISKVSDVADAVSKCDEAIQGSDVVKAAEMVNQLKTKLSSLPPPNSEISTGKVCSLLCRESQIQRFRFVARLRRLLAASVRVEVGSIHVIKSLSGMLQGEDLIIQTPLRLEDIWRAVLAVGDEDSCMKPIVEDIWCKVLKPQWKERKLNLPHIVRSSEASELVFDGSFRDGNSGADKRELGVCRAPFPLLLESISHVLNFLCSEVSCEIEELSPTLSAHLNGPSISLKVTLQTTLLGLLPKTEAELAGFQRSVERPCRDFDNRLSAFGLEASGGTGELSRTVESLGSHFCSTQRRELLGRARSLVLSDYHNTMIAAGDAAEDDPSSAGNVGDQSALMEQSGSFVLQILRFESCQVSLAACRILKLIHEILKQACESTSMMCNMLYQTARDCLELFMAIVPMRFADIIDTVPRMGAVFFNDCCYIAHNCTLITRVYRDKLIAVDESLGNTAGLVDFIPRFRSVGESTLTKHLEMQRTSLLALLERVKLNTTVGSPVPQSSSDSLPRQGSLLAGGLQLAGRIGLGRFSSDTSGRGAFNDTDCAGAVVKHLENLSGYWQGVLQESVYLRLLTFLMEDVMKQAMKPVLEADCITEGAGSDLCRVFRKLQSMRSVLVVDRAEEEKLVSFNLTWKKFCGLTDLLEFSLSEVAEWLPRKKFSSFTGSEMGTLIRALFEDSPKRQAVLTIILEMST